MPSPLVSVLLACLVTGLISIAFFIHAADRFALRAVHHSRARVNRFKLAKRPVIKQELLSDEQIAAAVIQHAADNSIDEAAVWRRVEDYIDEIVPFFNILTYYRIGLVVSRALLNFF